MINIVNRVIRKAISIVFVRPLKLKNVKLVTPTYISRHEGRDILVVATGPSLETHQEQIVQFIEKNAPIIITVNSSPSFLKPDYRAFTSRLRWQQYAGELQESNCRVLLSPYFPKHIIRKHYRGPYEKLMYVNSNSQAFDIRDGIIQSSCRTSAPLLIGTALVMGAGRIFVVGMDGYSSILKTGGKINQDNASPKYGGEFKHLNHDHYQNLQKLNTRFLKEINQKMSSLGKTPFKIITPTEYCEHYDPIENYL